MLSKFQILSRIKDICTLADNYC